LLDWDLNGTGSQIKARLTFSLGLWDFGIKAIAEGLHENTTLTEIDLRNNRIGGQGAAALADVLRKNNALVKIGNAIVYRSNFRFALEQFGTIGRKSASRSCEA
jgi:hypothetical protein